MAGDTNYLSFPFDIGASGAAVVTDADSHIKQEIEQILLTNPGERVNLPGYGCGIRNLVFAGNNPALASTTKLMIVHSLQLWLGDKIKVELVNVNNEEETLFIEIIYTRLETNEKGRFLITV
jgi:phage baseplate assembly protein W